MDGRASHRRQLLVEIFLGCLLIGGIYFVLDLWDPRANIHLFDIIKAPIKVVLGRDVAPGAGLLLGDLLLFVITLLLAIGFWVQFALPVQSLRQRLLAWLYLLADMVQFAPPPIRIRDGVAPVMDYIPQRRRERGFGILLLDTASGAMLRTRTAFTRAIGPGLHFTGLKEYLADTVDLHRQVFPGTPWGPAEGEDPFSSSEDISPEDYKRLQRRRNQTSGVTRDGVEVVPNIFVVSRLDPDLVERPWLHPPKAARSWFSRWVQGATPFIRGEFRYNPESVRLAITGKSVTPRGGAKDDLGEVEWFELPLLLAVDLWREYLRRFTFEELFTSLPAHNDDTALQVIQRMVRERLTEPSVTEINSFGNPGRQQVPSYEYEVLQDRGIRVLYAPIRNLRFPPQVERDLEHKWFSFWKWRAETEREYVDRKRSYRMHAGQQDALREFALHATSRFTRQFLTQARGRERAEQREQMQMALENLVRGTLAQCVNDTQLHKRLQGEENQLLAIIDWLRRQRRR